MSNCIFKFISCFPSNDTSTETNLWQLLQLHAETGSYFFKHLWRLYNQVEWFHFKPQQNWCTIHSVWTKWKGENRKPEVSTCLYGIILQYLTTIMWEQKDEHRDKWTWSAAKSHIYMNELKSIILPLIIYNYCTDGSKKLEVSNL